MILIVHLAGRSGKYRPLRQPVPVVSHDSSSVRPRISRIARKNRSQMTSRHIEGESASHDIPSLAKSGKYTTREVDLCHPRESEGITFDAFPNIGSNTTRLCAAISCISSGDARLTAPRTARSGPGSRASCPSLRYRCRLPALVLTSIDYRLP